MTKANTIPPQGGSRPTGLQLVASWQAIWNASLKGEKRALLDATNAHVALFPPVLQPEALARVQKITGQVTEPRQIRALIERGNRAANNLITAKA